MTRRRRLARALAALMLACAAALAGCGDDTAAEAPAGADVDPVDGDPSVPEPEDPGPPPPAATPTPTPAPSPSPGASPPPAPTEVRQLCFSPKTDCMNRLISYARAEQAGIDIAIYHLYDRRLTGILVEKHRAGIPVRVLADRHAYTIKEQHKRELDFLASNGVPIRTNRFRGIIHHKYTILHGLGLVEQGSMNYTSLASRKIFNSETGQTEWNEEMAFFTDNPRVLARYKERFDRAWANAGDLPRAYQPFTANMTLPTFAETEANPPTTCYEDPVPSPRPVPDSRELVVCFGSDEQCNKNVVAPLITAESQRLDLIAFRITVSSMVTPILDKARAGLPVRLIFEKSQYNSPSYPSMTKFINDLHAIGKQTGKVAIKATAHPGFMHMKSVITSSAATWGSGNFTDTSSRVIRGCQRSYYQTEDMIIAKEPGLVAGMRARFDEMWNSPDFADFNPDQQGGTGGPEEE
jgi:phosphatidylserine/phosphatidylglycerophosphate/cardiolipin synthase-like enzyme